LPIIIFIVTAISLTAQNIIDVKVKNAVDNFGSILTGQRDVQIGEITLDRTKNMTTELSFVLFNKAKHYTEENARFKVITFLGSKKDDHLTGIISGKYSITEDMIEVYMNLIIDGQISSQSFSIPITELKRLNIAYLPDNYKTIEEAVKQEKFLDSVIKNEDSSVQRVNLQARFDSGNRTYFHRDRLKMTVVSDQNCYFKIIHIDINNQMKMIYPNSYDRNNYLTANIPSAVFDNADYMLYGPYGAETILIVASGKQFTNIEPEIIASWIPATEESVRITIRGDQSGDVMTFFGEVRYSINILKPHVEYEYERPPNMTETVQTMRNEILQQGGFFEGNETSGYSILNNIRGSYRVPRDKPDTIQVAIYYDNYTNGFMRTRGGGGEFNFSFEKPRNLTQAIQTVRAGIEGKGGKFSGDEQQGSFQAMGILGRYMVSDFVNVTITEKPFLFSHKFIENEIKNYFGGQ
jgi:hypothetical protein